MPRKWITDKPPPSPSEHRERLPQPSAEERARRKAIREAEAIVAMAEEETRQRTVRANMERQRAERIAKEKDGSA